MSEPRRRPQVNRVIELDVRSPTSQLAGKEEGNENGNTHNTTNNTPRDLELRKRNTSGACFSPRVHPRPDYGSSLPIVARAARRLVTFPFKCELQLAKPFFDEHCALVHGASLV